jgi:hypothetical protein
MNFDVDGYKAFKKRYPLLLNIGATEHWARKLVDLDREILADNAMLFHDSQSLRNGLYLSIQQRFQKREIQYLQSRLSEDELKRLLLEEEKPPFPIISEPHYTTTEARVHHLTHLATFHERTGVNPIGLDTVVEFGGGYGGMCKVTGAKTHIIIDFPAPLFLQKFYLQNHDSRDIHLHQQDGEDIRPGINLVPVFFQDTLNRLNCDLLLTCWSLCEASDDTRAWMRHVGFFDADYILHGDQRNMKNKYFEGYEVLYDAQAIDKDSSRYLFLRKQ